MSGDSAGDSQVFDRAQFIFYRVLVSEVCDVGKVFFSKRSNVLSVPTNFARRRRRQPAENPQQACLAAAIRATEFYQFAAGGGKRQALEQSAVSANAPKIYNFQH